MILCHFGVDVVTDKEIYLLVFGDGARRGFLTLGSHGKIFWAVGNEVWTTLI
jgi:hypothetical protein